jgi:hypothetical protein
VLGGTGWRDRAEELASFGGYVSASGGSVGGGGAYGGSAGGPGGAVFVLWSFTNPVQGGSRGPASGSTILVTVGGGGGGGHWSRYRSFSLLWSVYYPWPAILTALDGNAGSPGYAPGSAGHNA